MSTPLSSAVGTQIQRHTPQTRRTPGPVPARPSHHARLAQPHLVPASSANKTRKQRAYKTRPDQPVRARNVFGRLPWFAPCLRRSRRLRPLFDIVVSSKTEISNLYSFSHPQRFSKQRAPCESKLTILSSSSSPSHRSWRQSVLEEMQVRVRRGSVPVASEHNARCTSIPGSGNSAKCVQATAHAERDPSGSQS